MKNILFTLLMLPLLLSAQNCEVTEWQEMKDRVLVVAHNLNQKHSITTKDIVLYDWLMNTSQRESGFDLCAMNPVSFACGLWQWHPKFYPNVPDDLEGQAQMMEAYLDYWIAIKGIPKTREQLYLLILYPSAMENEWIVFQHPNIAYTQNRGLDFNQDSIVSAYEIRLHMKKDRL